jgi:hypothetical protein
MLHPASVRPDCRRHSRGLHFCSDPCPHTAAKASLQNMSIAHGIRTLGVLGAGQMGTGIALVSALRAKVPVLLYDKSADQVKKGLSLVDKLLEKDVGKGRVTSEEAKDARDKIRVVDDLGGMKDVDMVVEVRFLVSYGFSHCVTDGGKLPVGSFGKSGVKAIYILCVRERTETGCYSGDEHKFHKYHQDCHVCCASRGQPIE